MFSCAGRAVKTTYSLSHFSLESSFFGFVQDVETTNPLISLRELITKEGIIIDVNYVFLFKRAPGMIPQRYRDDETATKVQEENKSIRDCIVTLDGNPTVILRKLSVNK